MFSAKVTTYPSAIIHVRFFLSVCIKCVLFYFVSRSFACFFMFESRPLQGSGDIFKYAYSSFIYKVMQMRDDVESLSL